MCLHFYFNLFGNMKIYFYVHFHAIKYFSKSPPLKHNSKYVPVYRSLNRRQIRVTFEESQSINRCETIRGTAVTHHTLVEKTIFR